MLKRTPENAKNFILWAVEKLYTLLFYHNCVENIVSLHKQECNVHYIEHKN